MVRNYPRYYYTYQVAIIILFIIFFQSTIAESIHCHRCGMEFSDDMNTAKLVMEDKTWQECCIICAILDIIETGDGTIQTNCTVTNTGINIIFQNKQLYSVEPNTALILYKGSCVKNKIFINSTAFNYFINSEQGEKNDTLYNVNDIIALLTSNFIDPQNICLICGNDISLTPTFLIYNDLSEERFCCTNCGFTRYSNVKDNVKDILVSDFNTCKLINAYDSYYVEGYFMESPCCNNTWIPFGEYQEARNFIFKNGGRIINHEGQMVINYVPVPPQNNILIYILIALICLILLIIHFFRRKIAKVKGDIKNISKYRKIIPFLLLFFLIFSSITSVALLWKPPNFEHRVIRLSLNENGEHTVVGELKEIFLDRDGSEKDFVIGFHFFNIIRNESPKNIHIEVLNPSNLSYTFYALDGLKFNKKNQTRLNVGFGNSFNIDILLEVNSNEYIGGIVFSEEETGEIYVNIPLYIIRGVGSIAGGGCH